MNVDVNAIVPVIEGIAQKLGIAAEHLWGVLIKQQYSESVSNFIWFATYMFIIWATIKIRKAIVNAVIKSERADEDEANCINGTGWAIAGIIFIFIGCLAMCDFTEGIKRLINPEYYALMDIISRLK